MQFEAKILFYNESEGKGIIITKEREKYNFYVEDWNDFDIFPKVGLSVTCKLEENRISSIAPVKTDSQISTKQEIESVIDSANSLSLWEKNRTKIDTIHLSVSVRVCVEQYFKQIEADIDRRTGYKSAKKRLNFLKMRRFLYTMYNNLIELDMHFITPQIKVMRDDLLQMSQVYDDYKSKATYPDIAFEKVFLARQDEYIFIRDAAEVTFAKLGALRESERKLLELIKEKEEILERTLRMSTQFERLDEEHKELKGEYVDTVHMMASLDEEYHRDLELMLVFEQEYKEEFFELFQKASKKYREQILNILDAQAFLFDEQLWIQAQRSKVIQKFFEESHIQGEYCSKTFLKYYLNSLDKEMLSQEQRELFEVYEYLDALNTSTIVAVLNDIDKVFHFKALFSKLSLSIESQVFIDTKKAFLWIQKHHVNIIIVDKTLDKLSGEKFIQQFKQKIGSRAKTVILDQKSDKMPKIFDMSMPDNIHDKAFKQQIEILLKENNG